MVVWFTVQRLPNELGNYNICRPTKKENKGLPSNRLVSVVIPAYNEESSIGPTLEKLQAVLKAEGVPFELLVVDDGSTDATAQIAADCGATVLHHPYNMGNGAAVKTGLRQAKGEVIALLDADGQHPPEDLPRLLELSSQYDLVVGARNPSSHASWVRHWGNKAYNWLASYITGREIEDLTSGFRVIKWLKSSSIFYPTVFLTPLPLLWPY